jgi:hypothetical protein
MATAILKPPADPSSSDAGGRKRFPSREVGWEVHFTAEEFHELLSSESVDLNTQMRIFRHLPQGCTECWRTLRQAGPTPHDAVPTTEPLIATLRLVKRPNLDLDPIPRDLVCQLPHRPLAFVHLYFDQVDRQGEQDADMPPQTELPAKLAVMAYTAAEQMPEAYANDIQARHHLSVARVHHRQEQFDKALTALETATCHLEAGTGDLFLETLRREVETLPEIYESSGCDGEG